MCLPSSITKLVRYNGSVPLEQVLVNICRRSNEFQWITTNHTRKKCFSSQFWLSFHPLKVSTFLVKSNHLGNSITRAECCPPSTLAWRSSINWPLGRSECTWHSLALKKKAHPVELAPTQDPLWKGEAIGSHLSGWLVRATKTLWSLLYVETGIGSKFRDRRNKRVNNIYRYMHCKKRKHPLANQINKQAHCNLEVPFLQNWPSSVILEYRRTDVNQSIRCLYIEIQYQLYVDTYDVCIYKNINW